MTTKTTARRYTSPTTPPSLTTRVGETATGAGAAPLLCLRCGYPGGHNFSLVTFAWSGLGSVRSRR